MKTCTRCGSDKDDSEFPRIKARGMTLGCWCRSCKNEYSIARARAAGVKPKRVFTEKEAKERRAIRYKKWYLENKDYFKKRMQNPNVKMIVLMRTRVSNAIRRFSALRSKSKPTTQLIGCSIEKLAEHLESKFRDGMTWENYGQYWHIDHIRPCSSFDLDKESEQRECFSYKNLQPLLKHENLRKNNKYAHQTTQSEAHHPKPPAPREHPMVAGREGSKEGRSPRPTK